MDEPRFQAALIASEQSVEMEPVRETVRQELAGWPVHEYCSLPAFIEAVTSENFYPDLVIVCQGWREQYALGDIQTGLAALPVARWICVVGAWCESEGRHGSRWPLAVRQPIRSFCTRLLGEKAIVLGQRPALPITADREEIYEFDSQTEFPAISPLRTTASVISPDRELRFWLEDVLRQAGFQLDGEPPDLILADVDPAAPAESCSQLAVLRQEDAGAKIVALLGRGDRGIETQLENAGADLVLSKLTPAAEFVFALENLCRSND